MRGPPAKCIRFSDEMAFQQIRACEERERIEECEAPVEGMSAIEQLPRELVWKLIEYAPKAVYNLRLTSSVLQTRVDEYSRERVNLCFVEKFILFIPNPLPASIPDRQICRVTLCIPNSKTNLFESRFKYLKPILTYIPKIERSKKTISEQEYVYYSFELIAQRDEEMWLDFVRNWMGRTIENVEIEKRISDSMLKVASQLLKECKINNLSFFSYNFTNGAWRFLKSISACHLFLSIFKIDKIEPALILLDLSSIYQSMHIYQRQDRWNYEIRNNYFFGLQNHDWAPLIVDMFSKKLEMLRIQNPYYGTYLSGSSADELIKHLPQLGKKIWFQSTFPKNTNRISFESNGHFAARGLLRSGSELTIVHNSNLRGPSFFSNVNMVASPPSAKRLRRSPEAPGDAQSSLEKVPRKLVWQLIEYAPESDFCLRMTSTMFRRRVDEYTSQRFIMPLTERLTFSEIETTFLNKNKLVVNASVPTRMSKLFELRFKSLNSRNFPIPMKMTYSCVGRSWTTYKISVVEENGEQIDFLNELIGRKIKKVEFLKYRDDMQALEFKIIHGIEIGHISFVPCSLNDAAFALLKTTRANHLSLTAGEIETSSDWKNVLLELSSLFQSLYIDQTKPTNSNWSGNNVLIVDWASVILEMFSRKLNKLHIKNNIDAAYLSKISADKLSEHLPQIGKRVWFTTICSAHTAPFEFKSNKLRITYKNGILSVKHRSRRHELSSFY